MRARTIKKALVPLVFNEKKVEISRSQLEEKKPIFAMDPGAGRAPGNPVGSCLIIQS